MTIRKPRAFVALLSIVLVLAACGGDGASGDDTTTAAPATNAPGGSGGSGGSGNICRDATEAMSEAANAYTSGLAGAMTGDMDFSQLEETAGQLQAMAQAAPDEIRDDFGVLAGELSKLSTALAGIGLQPGQAPSVEQMEQLSELSDEFDADALDTASDNLTAWFEANCS